MLSVAKLAPGQEAYYERSVAGGLDDYYAGRGESPGVWAGRGATSLELAGVVGDGELGLLIGGRDPLDGRRLREHAQRRTIRVEEVDAATGDVRAVERELRPVAGFDLVFGAPKSVSLLHALGDERTRLAVVQGHEAAWQAALSYLEDEACVVRRGRGGVVRERGPGFVAAAYQHRTSRAQDPHLHTHVIVANMARGDDGAWRALDGDLLLRTHRLAAGHLYQAHLRAGLTASLGVEWRAVRRGMAEIAGIPAAALREFSTRRRQIEQRLEESGADSWRAAQVAALETRDAKEPIELVAVTEQWWARAQEYGLGPAELDAVLARTPFTQPSSRELRELALRLVGPDGLTRARSTFTNADVVVAVSSELGRGASAELVRELAGRIPAMSSVELLEHDPGRPARYTTREVLQLEARALEIAARGVDVGAPCGDWRADDALSAEQQELVQHLLGRPDRVVCAVGLAGAGKTTATRAVSDGLVREGVPVFGVAPSGVAAERLQDESGIRATTIHRLLLEPATRRLPERCVVIVDEAGMADTRSLSALLDRVERARGKVILIGDTHQLQSVGPGGLFSALVERLGAAELRENRRQLDPVERELLAQVREGQPLDYLGHAVRAGRLVAGENLDTVRGELLADWWVQGAAAPERNVMLSYRRTDVVALNEGAHELMDRAGRLGTERLQMMNGEELASGDRVLCRRNDARLQLTNGTRGVVAEVDRVNHRVTIVTDRGSKVRIGSVYLDAGHLRLGYAMTGHASQGITVDRAFVLASPGGAQREWGYVALSRARTQTRIYLSACDLDPDLLESSQGAGPPLAQLARALQSPAAEPLALSSARHPPQEIDL